MNYLERESVIKRCFRAWLKQDAGLLDNIFDPRAVYSESWGPRYQGWEKILHWFNEWNGRARVLQWDSKRFIHQDLTTVVEWYFCCQYGSGRNESFDGVSIFEFTPAGLIISVKEFASKLPHYDPYAN